jgi:hypothetical protein
LLRKSFLEISSISMGLITFVASATGIAHAANISNFQQVINPGTLAIDIVDAGYVTVATPAVVFTPVNVSFSCQTSTGTLGTASQQVYISNPDAADNGWTASIAATAGATALWDSTGVDFDFNDPTGAGCTDGGDADFFAGQLSIDPSGATLANGQCVGCTTTAVTLGSSSAFNQGVTDSITLASAAAGADDVADYTIQGIDASQTIPSAQPAASDYDIDMTLSIVAI